MPARCCVRARWKKQLYMRILGYFELVLYLLAFLSERLSATLTRMFTKGFGRIISKKLILPWTSWLALSNGLSLYILPKG